jgi:hypothetical protein
MSAAQTTLIILAMKTPRMVANWNSTISAASGKCMFNEKLRQLVDMEMPVCFMATFHVGYICKVLASLRVHLQRASNRHAREEIIRLDHDCLYDTLRTPTINPLLHCAAIGASSPTSVPGVPYKVVS